MKLVYVKTGIPVAIGDVVKVPDMGTMYVRHFREPHKPSSSGKIALSRTPNGEYDFEYYVGVVGAEWIHRDDRL